ncbi:hypothetical protein FBY03_12533 [Pseudomonas sp. SJZ079]|uniref:hypothetical protein n=1 Tax=Pseudomonas sp. SJZ079 TaxID=2572887 RepID=UPI00119A1A12|nr:hypothetical protein [Pseudomonas sp. SJZ079]TWC30209.1 hypothetical protein FBY03_12533 [Pseudomonas sp. SJZ079]
MEKAEFLRKSEGFLRWMGQLISSEVKVGFKHSEGVDRTLGEAFSRYRWPNKRVDIETPRGNLSLKAHSDFAANAGLLDFLSQGMQECLAQDLPDSEELADWARAIMKWGGVYTRIGRNRDKGNAAWLDSNRAEFLAYLSPVLQALSEENGKAHYAVENLRSNAGMTKIYSLILPKFVIYDSRVAAALAWLVREWSIREGQTVAPHLQFLCMRANTSRAGGKQRSPDEKVFRYFVASGDLRNHQKHATWNLRANWLIDAAIEKARETASLPEQWTSRHVEAALFMMGDDLAHAL